MSAPDPGGRLARIRVFPVKSLDAVELDAAAVLEHGGLSYDREYALVDAAGDYVNGKNEQRIHRVGSSFDPETGALSVEAPGMNAATFTLPDGRHAAEDWFSEYVGRPVTLRRDPAGGFPDDTDAAGPTVVSTASLAAMAGWFEGVDTHGMRRRLRANLEVDGVPAFWEDRLYGPPGEPVPFAVGGTTFRGEGPCPRCAVPLRDPDTGERTPDGFRERFVERRRATLPDWAERDRFDHWFKVMVNTRVSRDTVGERIAVGEAVHRG